MAFCPKCGSELVEGMAFCVKCGAPVPVEAQELEQSANNVPNKPAQSDYYAQPSYQDYYQQPYGATEPAPAKKKLSTGALVGIIAGGAVVIAALAFGGFKLFQSLDKQATATEDMLESALSGNTASNQGQAGGSDNGSGSFNGGVLPKEDETTTEPEATETQAPETTAAPAQTSPAPAQGNGSGSVTRDTLATETTTPETTPAPTTTPATTAAPETTSAEDKQIDLFNNMVDGRTVRFYVAGFHEVYTNADLNVRGTVTYGPSDASCVESERVQVISIAKGMNGTAALIEYSSQISGTARGYIPLSLITKNNGDMSVYGARGTIYVIWTIGDSFTGDHQVVKGESVYYISDEGGGLYCIMYPMDAGGWQIGYCRESDYNKYVSP